MIRRNIKLNIKALDHFGDPKCIAPILDLLDYLTKLN